MKRFYSDMNKVLSLEGLLCSMRKMKKTKASSEIGIVVTAFFLLLFIVMPIYLMIQEYALFTHFNQELEVSIEIALMNQLMSFSSNAFSEARLDLEGDNLNQFTENLKGVDGSLINHEIKNLQISLDTDHSSANILVTFNYDYVSKIILKGHLKKVMNVRLKYQLPMNL